MILKWTSFNRLNCFIQSLFLLEREMEKGKGEKTGMTNLKQRCLVAAQSCLIHTRDCAGLGRHCGRRKKKKSVTSGFSLSWDYSQFYNTNTLNKSLNFPEPVCLCETKAKYKNVYSTGRQWGPNSRRYGRHFTAAAWQVWFPSVCPAQKKANRSDLKQSCKVFEVYFSPAFLYFSFPYWWQPFQAKGSSFPGA